MLRPMLVRLILVALALAAPVAAAAQRTFTIGGEPFHQDEIIDARYLPSIDGLPTVMITFSEEAAPRMNALSKRFVGKELPFVLDGKTISSPLVRAEMPGDVIELSGLTSVEVAVASAKLISGKDPLPDSLED